MTRNYERTQRNNPHQLTIRQHCFPQKSIERFANREGRVHVYLIEHNKTVPLKPKDDNFCAFRTWDQRAEDGFMREIEDKYQGLADKIAEGKIHRRLTPEEENVVTDMYLLWNLRWYRNKYPIEDQEIKGASGVTHEYSTDDQELLEKKGFCVIRPDLSISGRHLTGSQIQMNIFKERKRIGWGILKSWGAEFIVPDNAGGREILPVTPNICLINRVGFQCASENQVAEMNDLAKEASEKLYFARSL